MKTLIIHVGAPKCGSTSIQDFFKTYKNPCTQKTGFIFPSLQMIESLNSKKKIDHKGFIDLLDKSLKLNDSLILSHELFFLLPNVIETICSLSSSKVSKIIIIGFSRRSSDFIVSLYNELTFTDTYINKVSKKIMLKNGINPLHFFGVERLLILTILNGHSNLELPVIKLDLPTVLKLELPTIMKWDNFYNQIEKLVAKYKVKMRIGILPNNSSSDALIQDFCKKADLTLKDKYKTIDIKSNPKFNSHLTESINNALDLGFKVPGLYEEDNVYHDISKLINNNIDFNSTLLNPLKEYIDSYFYESNLDFCNKYDLDKSYFAATKKYSKNEILDIIRNEMQDRITNNTMLSNYKELNGILTEVIFYYNKKNTLNIEQIELLTQKVELLTQKIKTETEPKKLSGIKLLWNNTPESIRRIGRKILGI
ncbi:MAG: hypothetical protein COA67_00670 [Lutibacter sp.]|nr:MAG: hypothetical protein COA67_00670 [Lutibacter sp.]